MLEPMGGNCTKIAISLASACSGVAWGGVGWRGVAWGGVGWGAIVLLGIAQESCAKALTCCCAELIFQRRGLSHGMVDGALAFISCTRTACDARDVLSYVLFMDGAQCSKKLPSS